MATALEQTRVDESQSQLERLFHAHHERVLRAAYRVTGNMADAEDAAQAVFLRLATAKGFIEKPESYLYRAAINGALDLLRRRSATSEVELETISDFAVSTGASPEREASSRELGTWLRMALATLSPRSAEMFVLRYLEDLDSAQIAQMMNTSRAVVAVTLHQARARLKKQYESLKRGKR